MNVDSKKSKTLNELARRIRIARLGAHISQDKLGKGIGLSDKSISSYEKGRSIPPLAKLKKIADFTNRPLSYFTQENIDEAEVTNKLLSIERELAEVKKLLRRAKK